MAGEDIKLTKLAKCAGCGAKVGAGVLAKLLDGIKVHHDPNLLVGFDKSDDASVYKISDELAIVQTVDFFPPIADDPYLFGQIAATNALSDIYAMGGEPKLCLNIMAIPEKMPMDAVHALLKGGYDDTVLDLDRKLQVEGRPYQRVLELVGPATLKDTCSHVSEGVIVCSTGQLGGVWYMEDFDPIVDLPPNGFLTSFYSGNVDEEKLAGLLEYVEQRGMDMRPTKVFSLDQMADAHRFLESSEGFGKTVVTE